MSKLLRTLILSLFAASAFSLSVSAQPFLETGIMIPATDHVAKVEYVCPDGTQECPDEDRKRKQKRNN